VKNIAILGYSKDSNLFINIIYLCFMESFFSHGKLLLTSEYFVLDGATALAVPTKSGQNLCVEEKNDGEALVFWEAYHSGQLWMSAEIDYLNWRIIKTNLPENAEFIMNVLRNIQNLSAYFQDKKSYFIKTNLEFPANFGWGSSSTLMANLAKWAGIDAFGLNEISLGGSGYDIAVAMEGTPILYQLKSDSRDIKQVNFNPEFKDELIFVHLNQKQDSREGIKLYKSKPKSNEIIGEFSDLTEKVLSCKNIDEFSDLMEIHEKKVSAFLGLETVKETCFPDCPVFLKSLGAWGGDFVMTRKFQGYEEFFQGHGFHTFFGWNEIIK